MTSSAYPLPALAAVDIDPALSPITLDDADLFAAAFSSLTEPISDTSFAASVCWSEPLHLVRAVLDGYLCVFSAADGDLSMMLPPLPVDPAQTGRLSDALSACFSIMNAANAGVLGVERSRIEYVPAECLGPILNATGLRLNAEPMPGDYVYDRAELVALAGGDLKNKRKLRSRFLRENTDITMGPITPACVPACISLLASWRRAADVKHEGEANEMLLGVDVLRERDERCTRRYLELIEPLGLKSMALFVGGTLVGFTIGEQLSETMGVVSVEKTAPGVNGAPQFIYSAFCESAFENATEINAGDDWGIATLRYTKESYRPTRMLGKSVITRAAASDQQTPDRSVIRTLTHRRRNSRLVEAESVTRARVRLATLADTAAIVDIEAVAFDNAGDAFNQSQIRRLISNPRARVGLAVVDGAPAGWCVNLIRSHLRSRSGRVYSVAVKPEFAGQGLGRQLLNWSLAALEAEGVRRVYLEVRAANIAALGLYQSAGFTPIRTLRDYYGTGFDGIRMRRIAESNGAPT